MKLSELTEGIVRDALVECKGDLIATSRHLSIRPGRLNSYVRTVPALKITAAAMEQVKASPEYDSMTTATFKAEIEAVLTPMQYDALEEIYDLAMMGHNGNPGLAEVKLKAAIHLRGPTDQPRAPDSDGLFRELNQLYQQNAPRIKGIRTTLTVEMVAADQVGVPVIESLG